MSTDTTNKNTINKNAFEKSFQELGVLLLNIKNDFDKYQAHFSSLKDPNLLERLISIEKDFENIEKDFEELEKELKECKKSVDEIYIQYQEVAGSINQLKLSIDEINQRYTFEKEQKLNFLWQLIVPIILSVLFFLFGIFFRSCSSIHNENIKDLNSTKSEYINFESNNK